MKSISNSTRGIIYIIISAFCFALMAVFVRLSGNIHFIQKAFFRNSIAFIIALIFLIKEVNQNGKTIIIFPKICWLWLFLRSASGSLGVFGNFYAIDKILLADAAILNKMAPFFTILFSFILLKEKIKPIPLFAIIIAFFGAMLIVKPSFDFSKTIPTLVAFIGGLGAGFAYACIRKLSSYNCNGKFIVLFFSAFSMILSTPYMIFNFNPMTLQQLIFLCLAGVCAAGGQFAITFAYSYAPAKDISIYDYSQIIFSTLMGLFFFGQIPDKYSFIGYFIIILMALLNFLWQKKQSKL